MENKASTIQEVAQAAGVSVATVSRVLNDSSRVKEETRKKVLHAINQLNYHPNFLGRDLRRAHTKRILLLSRSLVWPIMSDVYNGVYDAANKYGYVVMAGATNNNIHKERELLQLLTNRFVDGVILINTTLKVKEMNKLSQQYNIAQCFEWNSGENENTCCVSINNEQAAFDAVKHLIDKGHKRIAMISSKSTSSAKLRENGYRRALDSANIPYDEKLLKHGEYTYEDGVKFTKQLLKLNEPPTAIFCINDVLAVGAVNTIKNSGLTVPNDVAIVGFDDTKEAIMAIPEITTISQPKYEMGYKILEMLIHNITNEEKSVEHVFLEHELIIRGSTL
ncbi:LacI family DNA-binding transcriptional regulator [Niallia sp. 03133]|uniref:LacI family DNA-binding transcriptional regulator n=1 Tax=Niallia sp. 03133 TaxID=3458060 RepID=UPI00404447CB